MSKTTLALPAILIALTASVGAQTAAPVPTTVRKITIGGEGGWDYLTADPASKRLYVARSNRIIVVDTGSEIVVGEVTGTPGVHGVAVVPDLGKGFTSNGGGDTVTAFDLKTLKEIGRVKVGGRPDAIMFEPTTHRVFTFNHGSNDATAVDPASVTVAGTVGTPGRSRGSRCRRQGPCLRQYHGQGRSRGVRRSIAARLEPLVAGARSTPDGSGDGP